jgi:SAM-dependent methyltransferase
MLKDKIVYRKLPKMSVIDKITALAHGDEYIGQTSAQVESDLHERMSRLRLPFQSSVLDAGCGNGCFVFSLCEEFPFQFYGVDTSAELITFARKEAEYRNCADRCHFFNEDFFSLPSFATPKFDLILSIGSLYWNDNLQSAIKTWTKVAKPGCHLMISLNIVYAPLSVNQLIIVGPIKLLSALTIQKVLADHGWVITEWSNVTERYKKWLTRWVEGAKQLEEEMIEELGAKETKNYSMRTETYREITEKGIMRRVMIQAVKI